MARLNWSKSRKFRADEREEKYDPGTELRSGRIVSAARPDSLAVRAAKAEKEWLAEREKRRKQQLARRRAAKKPPNRAEATRLKMIRRQLGLGE